MSKQTPVPSEAVQVRGRRPSRTPAFSTTESAVQNRFPGTLAIAEQQGLLKGRRTLVLRGRMPEVLVAAAKQKTGISSDSKLLEAALASLAVADDYAEWLYSQRGTVDPDLDLEF